MATIRLCDYTKRRIASNEETYTLSLNGKSYEICLDALKELQNRLDSDEIVAPTPAPVAPVRQIAPRPAKMEPAEEVVLNAETSSPFDGPSEPQLVDDEPVNTQTARAQNAVQPIAVPNSIKERLPMPTIAQSEAVVRESQRFPAGGLQALTPGRQRNLAAEKLAQKEKQVENKYLKDKERLP
jgi:hypothetical protein